jgi:TPR repeat protein
MYKDGSGVPQDYAQARQWLEKAATQGNANAQFDLESLYAFGHGVPQDYAMARLWYEKAAAQGMRMGSSVGIAYTLGP